MRYVKFYFIAPLFFLFSQSGIAQFCRNPLDRMNIVSNCDYCQCSQGISPMETGSTGIRYEVRSLYRGAVYFGTDKQPNPHDESETYLTNQLTLSYRISESPITLSLSVPHVVRQSHSVGDAVALPLQTDKGEGIGDITTTIRYNHKHYIDESIIALSIAAGIKLPTGKDDIALPSGDYLDAHLQPGTGTTDFIIGGSGLWSLDRFGIVANLNYNIVSGTGAPSSNKGHHKFGNYFYGDVTVRYRIIPSDISESNLSLLLGIGGEFHAKETLNDVPISASGETIIYITPGIKYILSQSISADALIQLPIYQNLGWDPAAQENQRGQAYRIIAGLQYTL
jgi:hypothetical protein